MVELTATVTRIFRASASETAGRMRVTHVEQDMIGINEGIAEGKQCRDFRFITKGHLHLGDCIKCRGTFIEDERYGWVLRMDHNERV